MIDDRPFGISDLPARTVEWGQRFAATLKPGVVVALVGELGAGKTQFVRGVVAGLGGDPRAVSSPTFVLMQEYDTKPPVVHIDAYRIGDLDEVREMGWADEVIESSITLIEWADRIESQLPPGRITIDFEHAGERERRITRRGSIATPTTPCPICEKPATPDDRHYPFCSPRCKQVDLGRWFDGHYRLSRELRWDEDELDSHDPQ